MTALSAPLSTAVRTRTRTATYWLLLTTIVALVLPHAAAAQDSSATVVQVRGVVARNSVVPGDSVPVAIVFDIAPGWHIWTSEEQSRTLPTGMVTFDGAVFTEVSGGSVPQDSAQVYVDRIQWPTPHGAVANLGTGPQNFGVYEGAAVAFVPVVISPNAPAGKITLDLTATFQSCDDSVCKAPADIPVKVEITVAPGVVGTLNEPDLFKDFDMAVFSTLGTPVAKELRFPFFNWEFSLNQNAAYFFPLLLLVAFGGGFLLNFTPCVLPIIPLKIMGLSASAHGERRRTFMLGLAMSAGVAGFWLILGLLLGSVKEFNQISAFFQYPVFTIGVGVFIALMAVGMAGFYNIGLPQWVYAIEPKHESYGGSVIFGVMTAVLSTPCTAPLMGAAAAWAVTTKSPGTVMAVFLAIGSGMASPYLVLSAFPQLARKMPKTGPASDVLKQVMGLLLLAAAAYFMGAGVNAFLEDPSLIYWWVVSVIGAAAGVWLVIRTLQLAKSKVNKSIFALTGCVIALLSGAIGPVMTYQPLPWRKFTPAALAAAGSEGRVVVVDFTAEWCLICKALEKTVLESPEVSAVLNEASVVLLKADLTGTNLPARELMASLDRVSIPYLVVYSPNGSVAFSSDAYTPQQVIDGVRAAQNSAR